MKHKLLAGLLMSFALMIGFFTFNISGAHATVHAHAQSTSCGYHTVESDQLINASGLHVGVLILYADGCGNVKIDLHEPFYESSIVAISLSNGNYYQLYSRTCNDTSFPGSSEDCWSLPINVGHTPVFASGDFYNANWVEEAWAETGYHTGYN